MAAEVIVPENCQGWWGGPDTRPRCVECGKVAFTNQLAAERSAAKIRDRGDISMNAYQGRCGNWHVGHSRSRRRRRK